jgi:hypothetical protein
MKSPSGSLLGITDGGLGGFGSSEVLFIFGSGVGTGLGDGVGVGSTTTAITNIVEK